MAACFRRCRQGRTVVSFRVARRLHRGRTPAWIRGRGRHRRAVRLLPVNVNRHETAISPIVDIISELAAGRMVVLVDEEDRENEGDLLIAADFATAESINFMARYGRGLICLTLTQERCRQLSLPLMVSHNRS